MQKLNNSIEKLLFIVRASNCQTITQIYAKKITSADRCKNDGIRAADRITWIDNTKPREGMTDFNWTWQGCAPDGETSFLPEGDKHKLTGGSTSSPDQDGGSMRPPRSKGAVMPTVLTPGLMDPSMGPPSNTDRLNARQNEEKCKILLRHNEILYSLAIEKETERCNAGCDPYSLNVTDRKKKFDKKKEDIKKDFQKKRSSINARKPCKKN